MNMKNLLFVIALLAVTGCASVSSPFLRMRPDYSKVPEAELRAAARAVEQAVFQGERVPELDNYPGVTLDAPEIMQAIRGRAARAELVGKLLDSGFAYEQRGGTIKILNSREYKRGTNRRERDQNALLVMSENQNRWVLYESLVKASEWSPGALGAVQNSFYEARVSLMRSGQRYEDAQGNIVVK